jgi:AraC family transcriptional regulator
MSLTASLGRYGPALADYPPGATYGPHVNHDFEFVWVLAGAARWLRLDEPEDLLVAHGCLLLIRPGMRFVLEWDRRVPSRHGYAHFEVAVPGSTEGWPLVRGTAPPAPFDGWLRYLVWLGTEAGPAWRARAEDVLGALLRTFVCGPLPDPARPVEPPALAAALDHVRDVWARRVRPISTTELADAARVSTGHLSRLFRRHFATGPVSGLELVRLARARTLLLRSNLNVTQVAWDCGFDDPLHFSRRFRTAFGMPPREYRAGGGAGVPPDPPEVHALARRLGPAPKL